MPIIQRRTPEPFSFERGPTACLVLHGFSGSPAEIRPLGEFLAAREITVRAPLLPGHGTSPEELRTTRWPDWVRAAEHEFTVLKEQYRRVHVVGFSMGALISLFLAAHNDVVTVSSLACPAKLADWRRLFLPLAQYVMPYYPASVSNPEIAEQLNSYDRFPVTAIHSLTQLMRRVRKDLPRVTAPLLAMQGESDKWIVPESADYITSQVSSQELRKVMLPGRNHLITLERGREEVFQAVHEWIIQHP
jgi:carboxylesterase